jgi:triphosphoribosyl-dephospho-CoA synthase
MSVALQFAIPSARPAHRREHGLVAELIAEQAVLALLHELAAWPKPGLVSHVDSGSHADMDAPMMQAGAESLRPFFAELARAGQGRREYGSSQDHRPAGGGPTLTVTGGINSHRGAIFVSSAWAYSVRLRAQSPRSRPAAWPLRRFASAKS